MTPTTEENKQAGDVLQLHIPAFIPKEKIAAPAWTKRVECIIAAASCDLRNGVGNGKSIHAFTIPYNDTPLPVQNIELPVSMPAGSLIVVAVSLTYFVSKKSKQVATDNIGFMPWGLWRRCMFRMRESRLFYGLIGKGSAYGIDFFTSISMLCIFACDAARVIAAHFFGIDICHVAKVSGFVFYDIARSDPFATPIE